MNGAGRTTVTLSAAKGLAAERRCFAALSMTPRPFVANSIFDIRHSSFNHSPHFAEGRQLAIFEVAVLVGQEDGAIPKTVGHP